MKIDDDSWQILDIFADQASEAPLRAGDFPAPDRFPLNIESLNVQRVVLADLAGSASPLIIAGYASIDRLLDFCCKHCDADANASVRLLIGHEPFASNREQFTVQQMDFSAEAERYWLQRGISLLYSGKVIQMIELLQSGRVQARYLPGKRGLHAKIYVGDGGATIGSSNFTDAGMRGQLEANTRFTPGKDARRYSELVCIAENFWAAAESYRDELIDLLNRLLRVVSWQEALARAAAELLEGEWAEKYLREGYLSGADTLWPSQKQGIAQALTVLSNQGSVLIADATGAGKTRMGMYLIGAVHDQIIRAGRMRQGKAIMVCPPAVEENWLYESSRSGVSLETYSHGKLSHKRARHHELTIEELRRAQILCVDEGHNFLNFKSNRTQQLLRNMADHVVLLTATPINRNLTDLLRIADMLGADNLSPSVIDAFNKMLGAKNINRQLTEAEFHHLRAEIHRFTVRRTKKQLNKLVDRQPEAYVDKHGRLCRFPRHLPSVYPLDESERDCELADRIQELADSLYGVTHFIKKIEMPEVLLNQGIDEQRYLQGRMHSAGKLARYVVMSSLRSSRAALIEHIEGTEAAMATFGLTDFQKGTSTGNVIRQLDTIRGQVPGSGLSIALPDWLSDPEEHDGACRHDADVYREIANLARQMSTAREQAKADRLVGLLAQHSLLLAFDSRPITLALIHQLLAKRGAVKTLMAFGGSGSHREKMLKAFAPGSKESGVIGLCSDSLAEGVNLQQASCLVHLDMPSVVRIAEQRAGRVDRLDSPHETIEIWWPRDAESFALKSDERFIERYETVEQLLGSNMPLPDSMKRSAPAVISTEDMIRQVEIEEQKWDGIDDAFAPVRALVEGDKSLIDDRVYEHYRSVEHPVLSRVSLVDADTPWALFCITAGSFGAPRWVLMPGTTRELQTEMADITAWLRERLTPETLDRGLDERSSRLLQHFVARLTDGERLLLSRKKQRALAEFELIAEKLMERTADQSVLDHLLRLQRMLTLQERGQQPNWDEVASRWLDLIRPVWFEKLGGKRSKPLLLKDIRRDLLAKSDWLIAELLEHFREFPVLAGVEERIKACIVGVDGAS